ncbi:MAG: anhydro-N-acetylmuramic acid kinase, partial [Alphaproteobacteria bacterium]|nr:anhydro-N-acetylmuramic acid kinase [Alphaproteobacteria bacterium]
MAKISRAIGLMSGTSLDGIDAALIETDGDTVQTFGPHLTLPYEPGFRSRLRAVLGAVERNAAIDILERELTDLHAVAVNKLLEIAGMPAESVDLVGFHGQTINHRVDLGWTWQLGLGGRLAKAVGINTVYDFRRADVAAGGQGAPLAPVYHRALAKSLVMPVAILNLGGVGNITFLESSEKDPVAFDTGPASALLDDWISQQGAGSMDQDGRISGSGAVNKDALDLLMANPYFDQPYPKSLDRNAFDPAPVAGLSLEDGAATLAAFTVESVARGIELLPVQPVRILVAGGGRHNPTFMTGMAKGLALSVEPVEAVGWNGDALEAQAFAYMAVRSSLGLP